MSHSPQGPLRLAEDFYRLGHEATPVFLWDGPEPVLFEAGFTCLAPYYIADAKAVLGGRAPAWLVMSHVHFDHCGAAGFFQEEWPEIKIAAAPKSAKIIERPNAIKLITSLNQSTATTLSKLRHQQVSNEPFKPFTMAHTLDEGDALELDGGRRVEVLATPGHTWDSLSFYLPEIKTLIASEAVGTQAPGGYIVTEFLVSYAAYIESMRRLAGLELELLCQGHHLVHHGEAAQVFIARCIAAAEQFKDWVLRLLEQENGDQARVVELVKRGEYDHRPEPKQPLPAYLINLQARVACLAAEFGQPS